MEIAIIRSNGLGHEELSAIFHGDEVAFAARDGRHFLELSHGGKVDDRQRVAGRTGHVGVRFRSRGGDGGGACAHEGHIAGRGVHGGYARLRAGVRGGCVGRLGQCRGGERAAEVGGELRHFAEREAGCFLARSVHRDGHVVKVETTFACLRRGKRKLRTGCHASDIDGKLTPIVVCTVIESKLAFRECSAARNAE